MKEDPRNANKPWVGMVVGIHILATQQNQRNAAISTRLRLRPMENGEDTDVKTKVCDDCCAI